MAGFPSLGYASDTTSANATAEIVSKTADLQTIRDWLMCEKDGAFSPEYVMTTASDRTLRKIAELAYEGPLGFKQFCEQKPLGPRAMTVEEMQERFLSCLEGQREEVCKEQCQTIEEATYKMAFCMLCMIDGCIGALPGFELVPAYAKSNKKLAIIEGRNWWKRLDISRGKLHELWADRMRDKIR